uniref:Photosystem I assembly protein Ycf4 n=1 Tax=Selaginella tamariscina TaxID=137178 RepID=A0A482CKW6_9TRAC|nr:photosystem I assembly protein Ycf4 [Selaginella tamariscina]QBL76428.1 photosystem I assembly protein Ycf4 [Selaginella tamariscina]
MDQQSEWPWVEPTEGSRRAGNFFWARATPPGALGFLLVGIPSYLGRDLVPLLSLPSQPIPFAPQGIVMCFYGISGLSFSFHLWRTILWGVGSGCDRYNKQEGMISSPRLGFPGKNRRIHTRFPLEYVQVIRMEVQEGIDPRRAPRMGVGSQKQNVLLIRAGEHPTPWETERKAAELARPPGVPIEGLDGDKPRRQ